MTETSEKSNPNTSPGSSEYISSAELEPGITPSTSPAGETDLFGQPLVRAPHFPSQANSFSAQRAKARVLCGALDELASQYAEIASTHGLPMNGTYGRKFGDLPHERALDEFTENRLTHLAPLCGTTLYKHRLAFSATPLGRRVYRLRALEHRTSDSAYGGWPTPMAGTPAQKGYNAAGNTDSSRKTVALVGWPTPTAGNADGSQAAKDASTTGRRPDGSKATVSLNAVARTAGWSTPSSRDWKDTPGMATEGTNPDGSKRTRTDQLPRQAHGVKSSGSHAPTERPGLLNPEFSRWLLGLPAEWGSCAPTETR